MTQKEINKANQLLKDHVDRTDTALLDSGGQCITAYWLDGGQTLFYSIQQIEEHFNTH